MKIRFYQSDMCHTTSIKIDWPAWFGNFLYRHRKVSKTDRQWTPEQIKHLKEQNAKPLDINKIKGE